MYSKKIANVAIPLLLRQTYDYLIPNEMQQCLQVGMRVWVPFGKQKLVAVVLSIHERSEVAETKLKSLLSLIDDTTLLDQSLLQLCHFASHYYQHPIGDVVASAMPILLRQGRAARLAQDVFWAVTAVAKEVDRDAFKRAKKQLALLDFCVQCAHPVNETILKQAGFNKTILTKAIENGWLECVINPQQTVSNPVNHSEVSLNQYQQEAVATIKNKLQQFQVFLLDGVTGSGKTEVYLQIIDAVIQQNKQALVLVPEIGLTPQTLLRFEKRYNVPIVTMHSGLTDLERMQAWLKAKQGLAAIIIGTRSAMFTPFENLGVIILDEEHDASFKQQEGFRYSARDLAIVRAKNQNIPIILGSATPSLESFYNVSCGRYQRLILPQRAGVAVKPKVKLLDMRKQALVAGLARELLDEIAKHLKNNKQVLLFLNRRGYAPVLMCHSCGWVANCEHCDASLTLHQDPHCLVCHHCGFSQKVVVACPSCNMPHLISAGVGTEKLASMLAKHFPSVNIVRIDRDTTRKKGQLEILLDSIKNKEAQILIGTQMLAKGHHFPDVTLVAIVDIDSGLFSADFRALERAGQLIMQVAGRAGRADQVGTVLIQTHQPQHPLLQALIRHGYHHFLNLVCADRKTAELPPFSHLALLRAEGMQREIPLIFLQNIHEKIKIHANDNVKLLGPIPAVMEKRQGRYRALLLLSAKNRTFLQQFLQQVITIIEAEKEAKKVRWILDVDPQEVF